MTGDLDEATGGRTVPHCRVCGTAAAFYTPVGLRCGRHVFDGTEEVAYTWAPVAIRRPRRGEHLAIAERLFHPGPTRS